MTEVMLYYEYKFLFQILFFRLWEYVANLGFDEPAEVMMTETESQKCVVLKRKGNGHSKRPAHNEENGSKVASDKESRFNCKMDKHTNIALHAPIVAPDCSNNTSLKSTHLANKPVKNDKFDEKAIVQKIFHEVVNNYSSESHASSNQQEEFVSAKQVHNAGTIIENAIPSNSKQTDIAALKIPSAEAHMFIKKVSYSSMPIKLKELVTPADFYKMVEREIERCESAAKKSLTTAFPDNSALIYARIAENIYNLGANTYEVSQSPPEKSVAQSVNNSSVTNSYEQYSPKIKKPKTESVPEANFETQQNSQKVSNEESSDGEEQHDNVSISELIARKNTDDDITPIYIPTKKEPAISTNSSVCDSNVRKSVIVKKQNFSEQEKHLQYDPAAELASCKAVLPNSKQKSSISNSSQVSNKKIQARSNVSSDEINSSDSIATASDKLSDSSVSSSSSNKSNIKNSGDNSSNLQKSYIESVSDASTFKDVESISDIEVASPVLSGSISTKKNENQPKALENDSIKSGTKGVELAVSTSPASKSKRSDKSDNSVSSKSSTLKNSLESKKSDKPVTSASASGKTKKNTKQAGKNRPKNSPLSSSVPSLSDITTVSSQSLNTDSIMKQISGSENDAKRGN